MKKFIIKNENNPINSIDIVVQINEEKVDIVKNLLGYVNTNLANIIRIFKLEHQYKLTPIEYYVCIVHSLNSSNIVFVSLFDEKLHSDIEDCITTSEHTEYVPLISNSKLLDIELLVFNSSAILRQITPLYSSILANNIIVAVNKYKIPINCFKLLTDENTKKYNKKIAIVVFYEKYNLKNKELVTNLASILNKKIVNLRCKNEDEDILMGFQLNNRFIIQ